ncbi:MAG: glycoside hydrolase family 5 protein [Cytophagales bacterium]|nr:glycoside hydrolase family 5 protein [Cytophagales bacterium]
MKHFPLLILFVLSSLTGFSQQFVKNQGGQLLLDNKSFELNSITFNNLHWKANQQFNNAYQNIELYQETDYQEAKQLGFNAVELQLVQPYDDTYQKPETQLTWIKQQIEWAKKHDLFIILSLEGYNQIDLNKKNLNLWTDEKIKEHTIGFWQNMAKTFTNESSILGYKLLTKANTTSQQWKEFSESLTKEIRKIDQKHLIIITQNQQPYFEISDNNTLYNFQFNKPTSFSQQNRKNGFEKYPSTKNIFPQDLTIHKIDTSSNKFLTGKSSWTYYEGKLFHIPDSLHEFPLVGSPILTSSKCTVGSVYFGEFIVEEFDTSGIAKEILRIHPYNSDQWKWNSVDKQAYFRQYRSHDMDNNDVLAIRYATNLGYCYNPTLRFPIKKGCKYRVSGWSKGVDIPFEALNCFGLMIEYSPKKFSTLQNNKDLLAFYLKDIIAFKNQSRQAVWVQYEVSKYAFQSKRGASSWIQDVESLLTDQKINKGYSYYLDGQKGIYELKKKGKKAHKRVKSFFASKSIQN